MQCQLPNCLARWPGSEFAETFCREVEALPPSCLPLQRAMTQGSQVVERPPQVMLLSSRQEQNALQVRAGVFFRSMITGCNCSDDPSPPDELSEYCELAFTIDIVDASAQVEIL